MPCCCLQGAVAANLNQHHVHTQGRCSTESDLPTRLESETGQRLGGDSSVRACLVLARQQERTEGPGFERGPRAVLLMSQ